jgi:hypothetical protein
MILTSVCYFAFCFTIIISNMSWRNVWFQLVLNLEWHENNFCQQNVRITDIFCNGKINICIILVRQFVILHNTITVSTIASNHWPYHRCLPEFFLFVRWDFGYCGHYWPIVLVPDDR